MPLFEPFDKSVYFHSPSAINSIHMSLKHPFIAITWKRKWLSLCIGGYSVFKVSSSSLHASLLLALKAFTSSLFRLQGALAEFSPLTVMYSEEAQQDKWFRSQNIQEVFDGALPPSRMQGGCEKGRRDQFSIKYQKQTPRQRNKGLAQCAAIHLAGVCLTRIHSTYVTGGHCSRSEVCPHLRLSWGQKVRVGRKCGSKLKYIGMAAHG